jgi:hypothetical protein
MPEKIIKVRVSDRWRVVHDGKAYTNGDTLTVSDHLAQEWEPQPLDRTRYQQRWSTMRPLVWAGQRLAIPTAPTQKEFS